MTQAELDRMNAEANAFAMELLMPTKFLLRDAAGVDLCDDNAVAKLAKKYGVPAAVMAARLAFLSGSEA